MIKKLREPVNGLTHFFAALVALVGLIALLIIGWGNTTKMVSLAIYGISLVLLFSASATYHMVKARPKVELALRKFDHAAIYLLIAGTYTPIHRTRLALPRQKCYVMPLCRFSLHYVGIGAFKQLWVLALYF